MLQRKFRMFFPIPYFCLDQIYWEMFQQIKLVEKDQFTQRYLWRKCLTQVEPDIYVMESMIFGSTSSSACTQAVKKKHNAMKFVSKYPEAVDAILNQHYLNDYLDSFSDMEAGNIGQCKENASGKP